MEVSKEKLKEIVDQLDFGFKVFININSQEIVSFPDEDQGFDIDPVWQDEVAKVRKNKKAYFEIEPLTSRESYEIMESFIGTIKDEHISAVLLQAIEGRKPFANFNHQIHQLDAEKKEWFEFKESQLMEYVRNQLKLQGS